MSLLDVARWRIHYKLTVMLEPREVRRSERSESEHISLSIWPRQKRKPRDRWSRDTPKSRRALFIARAPSDNDGSEALIIESSSSKQLQELFNPFPVPWRRPEEDERSESSGVGVARAWTRVGPSLLHHFLHFFSPRTDCLEDA